MASFRRTLSPSVHDRSSQNGTTFPLLSHTVSLSSNLAFPFMTCFTVSDPISAYGVFRCLLSWIRISHRQGAYEKLKSKGLVWKKPFLHIVLCFVLGFLVGLTPFTLPGSVNSTKETKHEFAPEVKAFPTSLQPEVNNHGGRERRAEELTADNAIANIVYSRRMALPASLGQTVKVDQISDLASGKLLIVVTPTHNRPFQAVYLARLSHTLKLVPPPLLWLVVEMHGQTMETAGILRRTGLMYRHLVCDKNATLVKDRGVHQRNVALAHIEQHQLDGVVYFADDDNVYTLELFEQMRKIKRFGTWPVGMLAHSKSKAILEGPVCDGEKVIGWHTNEKSKRLRRFHVDMCGFGFNSTILWDPHRWQKLTPEPIRQLDNVKEGFQETTFIEQLVEDESQMEGFPDGCSKVLVWHLHLEAPGLVYPSGWSLHDNLNATISFPGKS